MEGSAALQAARVIYALRQHAGDLFPVTGSNIPLDICLVVALRYHEGRPLTMKQLTRELPYSEAGLQYNVRMLKDQEWIFIRNGVEDRRVRQIIPARRLEAAILEFQSRAEITIADDLVHSDLAAPASLSEGG